MSKTDSKDRMKQYRADMTAKGYISTTIFLSQEHRAELKRLGDEYRLTRAEAAELIFKAYLESDNTDVTQTYNINKDQVSAIHAAIEDLDARLKVLESNQVEPDNKHATQTDNTNMESQPEKSHEQEPETQTDILEGIDPENVTVEDRDRLVLKLYEQFPEKKQAKDRIKVLNDAGILFNGEPWTTKQYSDQLNLARKRVKK